jgi:hypothetical protein
VERLRGWVMGVWVGMAALGGTAWGREPANAVGVGVGVPPFFVANAVGVGEFPSSLSLIFSMNVGGVPTGSCGSPSWRSLFASVRTRMRLGIATFSQL